MFTNKFNARAGSMVPCDFRTHAEELFSIPTQRHFRSDLLLLLFCNHIIVNFFETLKSAVNAFPSYQGKFISHLKI